MLNNVQEIMETDSRVPTIELSLKIQTKDFIFSLSPEQMVLDLRKLGYERTNMSGKFIGEYALNINYEDQELLHIGSE